MITDRETLRKVLALLVDIANSPANMGCDDIDRLCSAIELIEKRLRVPHENL